MSSRKKILITSCFAKGDVVSMRNMAARFLMEGGIDVDFASYAPFRLFQNLSVPMWQVGPKLPSMMMQENHWWVGSWLPEWEFMRSRQSSLWNEVFSKYENHLVVSGTAMAANPLIQAGINPLCWLATPYWDERYINFKNYPWYRKLMTVLDKPQCQEQEKKVLSSCPILTLGSYSQSQFLNINPDTKIDIMPMPVDSKTFIPGEKTNLGREIRLGFCGRLDDPRKNISFLLRSFALLKNNFQSVRLILAGGQLNKECSKLLETLNIKENVKIIPFLAKAQLVSFYQSLDLFIIPSTQEGLGIVGLEAMACGLPIVSTTCGGPQDFVYSGGNGHLVHFQEKALSNAIIDIISDERRWKKMRQASIEIVQEDFNYQTICEQFWGHYNNNVSAQMKNVRKKAA